MKKNILIIIGLLISINLVFASCSGKGQSQTPQQTQTIQSQDKVQDNPQTTSTPVETKTSDAGQVVSTPATGDDPWKKINPTKVNVLTTEMFKQLIFDYTKSKQWAYKGDRPCVIDFYADWCRPCRYVSPIMEQLAEEYKGKVIFFKVNVDNERELAQIFGIQSIPSVLFCPVTGSPQMAVGAMQKENYIRAIKEITGVEHPGTK